MVALSGETACVIVLALLKFASCCKGCIIFLPVKTVGHGIIIEIICKCCYLLRVCHHSDVICQDVLAVSPQ